MRPSSFNGAGHLCARKAAVSVRQLTEILRFNGAGHLCARKAAYMLERGYHKQKLQWGRASVCPEGAWRPMSPGRDPCFNGAGHLCARKAIVSPLFKSFASFASMGPGICVPGRLAGACNPSHHPLNKLQWGRASVCPEGPTLIFFPSLTPYRFNGAGHLCARKVLRDPHRVRHRLAASMGPGICVPGRSNLSALILGDFSLQWGRASVCPEGAMSRPWPIPTGDGFNGAGHLCARKVFPDQGVTGTGGGASMGPGICVPGRPARAGKP